MRSPHTGIARATGRGGRAAAAGAARRIDPESRSLDRPPRWTGARHRASTSWPMYRWCSPVRPRHGDPHRPHAGRPRSPHDQQARALRRRRTPPHVEQPLRFAHLLHDFLRNSTPASTLSPCPADCWAIAPNSPDHGSFPTTARSSGAVRPGTRRPSGP